MKKITLTMAAAAALSVGTPAAAQWDNGGYQSGNNGYQNGVGANASMSARIEQLRLRIQAGVQSGAISRAEAQPLRQQLRALTQLERQYSVGGLTGRERLDLQQRLRSLRQQLRIAEGGAQGRYDRDDDYAQTQSSQDGRYDQGYDRNDDGFDDRDYDRDGRWDDDARNGSGNGAYEQAAARGGLGGIIDNALGRGSLRVGQRATGNLSALPYEYRSQFRDSRDAYFRTDGRQIYQIDARTQTVVRVYSIDRGVGGRSGGMGRVLGSVLGGGRSSGGAGGVLGSVLGGGGMGDVLGSVVGGGGGILGAILGRGGLRSGEVITDTIGSVLGSASGMGSQYRDTNNTYYRSDGQRVYEVDARTNAVNRVFPLQR